MKLYDATDAAFRPYGRILGGYEVSEIVRTLKALPLPPRGVSYIPSEAALEALPISIILEQEFFGGLPMQLGCCMGYNSRLDALEYHRSSEINIAASQAVLLLGRQQDIDDSFRYDTSHIEGFIIREGMAVEIYATTLHYAPCCVNECGFRIAVALPRCTNLSLENPAGTCRAENRLLSARNKWLIGHPDADLPENSYIGLTGENITLPQEIQWLQQK